MSISSSQSTKFETISTRPIQVGVDIGGTFTDIQIFDRRTGAVLEHKTASTPDDPSRGLLRGLEEAGVIAGFDLVEIGLLLHGTTIATNAVLEHKLPEGALITTAGFEDVLEIGRHMRHDVYGLHAETRRLLVPRAHRFGIPERIGADGHVVSPLDEAAVRRCARHLAECGLTVVAVCLINGFANPSHEQRIREILLEENPNLLISISSDISPEIREYERTSTTALNALLMPVVQGYMRKLSDALCARAIDPHVLLIQSNGGSAGMAKAGEQPARLLLSGPCGGTRALELLSASLDLPNLVGMDIGGTSCDISLVQGGRVATVPEGAIDGCPVRLPMVEIRTIGAGGGSIAWVDQSGRMRVGPQSAGADPGPVSYGRGGTGPTVTDANIVLGRIDPARFMGGAVPLYPEAARTAIQSTLCTPLGLNQDSAAEGIVAIANAAMVTAIRLSLFERGLDPSEFALVSFGGAGGLHAAPIAEELGIDRVIYPMNASTLSASGVLWSDIAHDLAQTRMRKPESSAVTDIREAMASLQADGAALLAADGVGVGSRRYDFALDIRYAGQGFELGIPLLASGFDETALASAIERFHHLHHQLFSHSDPQEAVELMTLRLTARGILDKPTLSPFVARGDSSPGQRRIFLGGIWQDLTIQARESLSPGASLRGPALIEERFTNLLIPAGWVVAVAPTGDLIARRENSNA